MNPQPVLQTYNTTNSTWMTNRAKSWNGHEWVYSTVPNLGVDFRSPFNPYLAEGSVFQRAVANMPLHEDSTTQAAWMSANSPLPGHGFGDPTSINTTVYNIPIYIVDSSTPGIEQCRMTTGGVSAGSARETYLNGMIPLPHWAMPSPGGDRSLALYDKGTGIMREYFFVTEDGWDVTPTGSTRRWKATTGGYYVAKRGLADLGQTNYAMQLTEGTSAVVGMLNPLSQIGIDEVRNGQINHAVSFTCADMNNNPIYSWPAKGGDGMDTSGNAPSEGQWCRIPPSLDIEAKNLDGTYVYRPFTRLVMRAMQTYGGYAADKNLFVHAFNVEPAVSEVRLGRPDPWAQNGELAQAGWAAPGDSGVIKMSDFPWHLTEWAPIDWGKP